MSGAFVLHKQPLQNLTNLRIIPQDIVKALFADTAFNAKHHLGAVNSINWARILAQTVYYFLSYFAIRRTLPTNAELQFIVPTGNFGDILAGYYAKRMGLPMAKLVIATNANDILTRFWKTGRYEKLDSNSSSAAVGGVVETLSPAMDILVSSNFERLLWYLAFEDIQNTNPGGDLREQACQTVKGWMENVKSVGRIVVPDSVLELARRDFTAERVDDKQVHSYTPILHRELCQRYEIHRSAKRSGSTTPPRNPTPQTRTLQ